MKQQSNQGPEQNRSETLEDLVESGDLDKAISFMEAQITKLEAQSTPEAKPQLATALGELVDLYESKGSPVMTYKSRSLDLGLKDDSLNLPLPPAHQSKSARRDCGEGSSSKPLDLRDEHHNRLGIAVKGLVAASSNADQQSDDDEDWETKAELDPEDLLPSPLEQKLKNTSLKDTNKTVQNQILEDILVKESGETVQKRRGRGKFSYNTQGMYSDQLSEGSESCDNQDKGDNNHQEASEDKDPAYGTHHVLVLDGFSASTTTSDLENLVEGSKGSGFSIRWVNDTVALAVFRTPADANDAYRTLCFPCSARVLKVDDVIMKSISPRDLEPPKQRPKTSTHVAQRLIAQGMGMKISSPSFGSRELRKQERERKSRIISRQSMKDDAWGDD